MRTETPWLTEAQQRAWRGWLSMSAKLPVALHRQLQSDSTLSLPDFEVLVHLTESPETRLRVSDLAHALEWERSRLSHHIKRMAARGLITREECPEDGRGAFVVLTAEGRRAIDAVAPAHALMVKQLVFDALTDAELAAFSAATEKILAQLERAAVERRPT